MQKVIYEIKEQLKVNMFLVGTFGMGMTFFIPLFTNILSGILSISFASILMLVIAFIILLIKQRKEKLPIIKSISQIIDMGIYSSLFVFCLSVYDYLLNAKEFLLMNFIILLIFLFVVVVNFLLKRVISLDNKNT